MPSFLLLSSVNDVTLNRVGYTHRGFVVDLKVRFGFAFCSSAFDMPHYAKILNGNNIDSPIFFHWH